MKFVNVFDIEHKPELVASISKEPSMTSTDLFLSSKQRIQNLLSAGQNLLHSRLGDEYFEQVGPVNENIKDRPLEDLHDYNAAVRDLADKQDTYNSNLNAELKKASSGGTSSKKGIASSSDDKVVSEVGISSSTEK